MSKSKLVILLAVTGLAFTACGSKDSYRGFRPSSDFPVAPMAKQTLEEKAIAVISADASFNERSESVSTQSLRSEFKAASVVIVPADGSNDVNATSVRAQVEFLKSNQTDCTPQVITSQAFSRVDMNKGLSINNFGRITCVDSTCNDIVLFVEKRVSSSNGVEFRDRTLDGVIAILMSKTESGSFSPVSTESDLFVQVSDLEEAVSVCLENKENGSNALHTPEEAQQIAQTQQAKLEREDRQTRILAIDQRLTAINAEIAAIRTSAMGSGARNEAIAALQSEINRLNSEKRTLNSSNVQSQTVTAPTSVLDSGTQARVTRLNEISARITAINAEIAAIRTSAMGSGARNEAIAALQAEIRKLNTERQGLQLHL